MGLGIVPKFVDTPGEAGKDEALDGLLTLVEADANALKTGVKVMDLTQIRETIEKVQTATPIDKLASPLSGQEIMQLTGLTPGKRVGELKRMLDEMVIEGQLDPDDKAKATDFVLDLSR